MSLINEALKRAEAEKQAKAAGHRQRSKIPLTPVRPLRRPHRPGRVVMLVAVVCLVAVGAGIWALLDSGAGTDLPTPARANAAAQPQPAAPAQPPRQPAQAAQPARPSQPELTEADLIVAKTISDLKYYTPPARSAPASAPAPRPSVKIDPNSLKLTAVMRGPDGATAIVNGQFVRVGSTVKGARVVKIDQHTVELEINGQTFTIQM